MPHIKDVCDRFAAEGFVALAPDLYHGETHHRARRGRQADDGAEPRPGRPTCRAPSTCLQGHDGRRRRRASASPASAWAAASPWCWRAERPAAFGAVRALVRPDPVGGRPARLVDARGHGARPLRRATTASSAPDEARELEAELRRWAVDAELTSSRAPTTPSSTTPGPRSTTPRRRPRLGSAPVDFLPHPPADDRPPRPAPVERYLRARPAARPPPRRPGRRLLRPARAGQRGEAERRARPLPALADDARPWSPTSTAATGRPRRRPPGAGCGPRSSACTPRARKLGGEAIAVPRRGRAVLRRPAARGRRGRRWPPPTGASTRRCPASGPLRDALRSRGARRTPSRPSGSRRPSTSLADDFRERTDRGLRPARRRARRVELLETDKPWSGFNYYLGDLRSRVAINIDLPVLATASATSSPTRPIPGTTPSTAARRSAWSAQRRPAGGVDLPGRHPAVPAGRGPGRPRPRGAPRPAARADRWPTHLRPLGVRYDAEVVAAVRRGRRGAVRRSGATSPCCCTTATAPRGRGGGRARALGAAARTTGRRSRCSSSPTRPGGPTSSATSRAPPLCRRFVAGDPARFERLLTEQLLPADLVAA